MWEYKVVTRLKGEDHQVEMWLDYMDEEGWMLISATVGNNSALTQFFFRRAKSSHKERKGD